MFLWVYGKKYERTTRDQRVKYPAQTPSGAKNTTPVINDTFGNLVHLNRCTILKIEDESQHIEYQGVKDTRFRACISDRSMPRVVYTKVLRAIGYMRYERAVRVFAMLSFRTTSSIGYPIGKMFSSNEEVERSVLRIYCRGISRAKPIEVGLQLSQKVFWCSECEKAVQL